MTLALHRLQPPIHAEHNGDQWSSDGSKQEGRNEPFHKVHDFADILEITKQNARKKITLPERYIFLAEHAGAIRATLLAGLERNPNTAPVAPANQGGGGTPATPADGGTPAGGGGGQQSGAQSGGNGQSDKDQSGEKPGDKSHSVKAQLEEQSGDQDQDQSGSSGDGPRKRRLPRRKLPDEPMEIGGDPPPPPPPSSGAAAALQANLAEAEAARARGRRQELEDELTLLKIRSEQHAGQVALFDKMSQTLKQNTRSNEALIAMKATQPAVTQVQNIKHDHWHQQAIQAIDARTVNYAELHQTTLNQFLHHAPQIVQIAGETGSSLLDAMRKAGKLEKKDVPQLTVSSSSNQPPPPPPGAGAVKRALAIENEPVRAPQPIEPSPLEPPEPSKKPKKPKILAIEDRELPSGFKFHSKERTDTDESKSKKRSASPPKPEKAEAPPGRPETKKDESKLKREKKKENEKDPGREKKGDEKPLVKDKIRKAKRPKKHVEPEEEPGIDIEPPSKKRRSRGGQRGTRIRKSVRAVDV